MAFGPLQSYNVDYHAREVQLNDGEDPRVIYIFGSIEPRYHSWEADFTRQAGTVSEFTGSVAAEAARLYPSSMILVMLGHRIDFLFDVSGIYEDTYLGRTAEGWRLERFYTGVMVIDGRFTDVWKG